MNRMPEVLVIGGGPAGAAVSARLARAGRHVSLIEQSSAAHHKVCGGFLSREAIAYLAHLGIDLRSLGAAQIEAVRLAGQREIAACRLPFPAMSLTRKTLDEALLAMAAEAGVAIQRGCRVGGIFSEQGGIVAEIAGMDPLRAQTVFLATGKHDVKTHRRPPGRQNDLVAFKMYFELTAVQKRALDRFVEIHLFPGGYAGLQLVEGGHANLCLLVARRMLRECDNDWSALLQHLFRSCDLLALRLDRAAPLMSKPLALSSIPYGMVRKIAPEHIWPLGDQFAVVPSFAGDGVSIALHSAAVAANLYLQGATSAEYARRLRPELRGSVGLATLASQLMVKAPVLAQAVRMWPGVLDLIALRTRIPSRAWASATALASS